jgi:hypothetical protein
VGGELNWYLVGKGKPSNIEREESEGPGSQRWKDGTQQKEGDSNICVVYGRVTFHPHMPMAHRVLQEDYWEKVNVGGLGQKVECNSRHRPKENSTEKATQCPYVTVSRTTPVFAGPSEISFTKMHAHFPCPHTRWPAADGPEG